MIEGRSAEALEAFAQALVAHGGKAEQIELISMDMSPAYQSGASRFFPRAQIVFDRFHLMQMAGEALDRVRKELAREGVDLKGSLWALRGNEWTRSQEQCQQSGNLNFNDELLTLDREVADYVIVHELLHFFVPNHGKLWKSLMRAHLGDYETLASKLPALRADGSHRIGGK